jgi:hypothetical protein
MDSFLFVALDYSLRGLVISLFGALWMILVLWYLATYLISPLRDLPGPFLAGELLISLAPAAG